jgi:hypothetical protein
MNANRKADLQRKLTLAPVPKPPAGLAERIKREIPKDLRFNAEEERERLSRAIAFNIRVAASILIVVASAFIGVHFLSRLDERDTALPVPAVIRQPARVPSTATTAVTETKEELRPAFSAAPVALKKQTASRRDQPAAPAELPAAVPTPAVAAPVAQNANTVAAARASGAAVAFDRVEPESQVTTSPVSGKEVRYSATANKVEVVEPKARNEKTTEWKDLPRDVKLKILQTELANGGDKKKIAKLAREAGLNEFADSIEKP